MVKLRLTRIGKKGQPHYRIIAIQARTKREGKALDFLGHYNPRTNPTTIKINKEKALDWLSKGAQPTETVKYLLIKEGVIKAEKSDKKHIRKNLDEKNKKEQVKILKNQKRKRLKKKKLNLKITRNKYERTTSLSNHQNN
jgi:small subunit ribosomal protein S16